MIATGTHAIIFGTHEFDLSYMYLIHQPKGNNDKEPTDYETEPKNVILK